MKSPWGFRLRWMLFGALIAAIVLGRVSCTKRALERVSGHEVSWWDAFILGGR